MIQVRSVAAIIVVVLFTTGCGVTLQAHRVERADTAASPAAGPSVPSVIRDEGIVYALPRTEFEIVQPVNLKVPASGVLAEVFETCRRACDANNDQLNGNDKSCDYDTSASAKLMPPEVRAVTVPDLTRLYRVSASADAFQTLDFKFDIAEGGVIDKADTSVTNQGYEIAAVLAKTVVAAVGVAALQLPSVSTQAKLRVSKATSKTSCYETSTAVDVLSKKASGQLSCSLMRDISSCIAPYDARVDQARDALNALFDQARTAKMDSDLLNTLAANQRERVESAVAKRKEIAALYGLSEDEAKKASFQVILPVPGPDDFKSDTKTRVLGSAIADGSARIVGVSDNAAQLRGALVDVLSADKHIYEVSITLPAYVQDVGSESSVAGGGYKYRVPVRAPVKLSVRQDPGDGGKTVYGPVVDERVIAQYGPIAALPSHFKGKKGRVMVKYWPNTGGLQAVEIGSEPLPTSTVTDVVDTAYAQYKARKDAAKAAATAAANVDQELDDLTRQQKILELKKAIKELEEALNPKK